MARGRRRGRFGGAGRANSGRRDGNAPVYAALDLGTNNCRLLMARPTRRAFRVVGSFSRIVRLGEGLSATGRLSEIAMARTVEALKICAARMKSFGVVKSRNIATEACRRAGNRREFVERVADETGLEFETIDTAEEARLGVAGCRALFRPGASHALVFDIGGGSTELTWVERAAEPGDPAIEDPDIENRGYRIADILSLPYGVVTLSESHDGDVTAAEYRSLVTEIGTHLRPFAAKNRITDRIADGSMQLLGTSGTVTTLGAVHLRLPRYSRALIDGLDVEFDALVEAGRRLADMNYEERIKQPCIGEERAELVVPGAAILEAIFETFPARCVRIADRGLREGMLLELIGADRPGATPPP